MTVKDEQLLETLTIQYSDEILENRKLGTRIEVHIKVNIALPRIYPKGNGGQHYKVGVFSVCFFSGLSQETVGLIDISSVRKVVIMSFDRTPP